MSNELILSAVSQGLLWAVMALGVFITYRILDFADLTAEGSFTLGAAVVAKFITSGHDPFTSMAVTVLAGMLAGLVTGLLHTVLKIPPLLSGILTMTGLYSINLRVMDDKANLPLLKVETIFTKIAGFGFNKNWSAFILGLICVTVVICLLWWFFNTEIGYALRATGNNVEMIRALGVNTNAMKILGLVLGNAMVAFSGGLVAQYNSFADVNMGIGTIVIGLAAVIVGEVVFSDKNNHKSLISVSLGSITYRLIIAFVLSRGLKATDLRLISSVLLVFALSIPMIRKSILKDFSIEKQLKVG